MLRRISHAAFGLLLATTSHQGSSGFVPLPCPLTWRSPPPATPATANFERKRRRKNHHRIAASRRFGNSAMLPRGSLLAAITDDDVNGGGPLGGGNHHPDVDIFDVYVKMRTGLGTGPGSSEQVFMICEGEVYESPSGRLLARFDGFDVTRGVRGDGGDGVDVVRQLTRKIFWFRDAVTGDVLTEWDGGGGEEGGRRSKKKPPPPQPVKPIKYDYQVIEYRRGHDELGRPAVLSSVVGGPRVDIPCRPCTARWAGPNQLLFQVPVFIDVMGYTAWEVYDFSVDPNFPDDRPPHLSWSRQGATPPFAPASTPPPGGDDDDTTGGGEATTTTTTTAVMHCTGRRVCSYDELPSYMRDLIEQEGGQHDMFREAPRDMAEIGRLQRRLEEKATAAPDQ